MQVAIYKRDRLFAIYNHTVNLVKLLWKTCTISKSPHCKVHTIYQVLSVEVCLKWCGYYVTRWRTLCTSVAHTSLRPSYASYWLSLNLRGVLAAHNFPSSDGACVLGTLMYLVCLPCANKTPVSLFVISTVKNAKRPPRWEVRASASSVSPGKAALMNLHTSKSERMKGNFSVW